MNFNNAGLFFAIQENENKELFKFFLNSCEVYQIDPRKFHDKDFLQIRGEQIAEMINKEIRNRPYIINNKSYKKFESMFWAAYLFFTLLPDDRYNSFIQQAIKYSRKGKLLIYPETISDSWKYREVFDKNYKKFIEVELPFVLIVLFFTFLAILIFIISIAMI